MRVCVCVAFYLFSPVPNVLPGSCSCDDLGTKRDALPSHTRWFAWVSFIHCSYSFIHSFFSLFHIRFIELVVVASFIFSICLVMVVVIVLEPVNRHFSVSGAIVVLANS